MNVYTVSFKQNWLGAGRGKENTSDLLTGGELLNTDADWQHIALGRDKL